MKQDMDRRSFLAAISIGMASASLPILGCGSGKKRPNILWIISEDTSPDFACYGHPIVKTPNLDRLAGEGMRFTSAFVTAPVCSPSRSAFNTGMYQTSIGAHNHRTRNKKPLPDDVRVITDLFREAGYFTSNCSGLDFEKPGKTDWNFTLDHKAFDGTDWRQRQPDQPFFAQVNLHLTHRPFVRDEEHPIDPDRVELPPIYPDHPLLRRDWADYLESIQVLDRQVGQVLQRLEEDGLADDTIVFYFGDHGRPHLWAKQWLYEGGIRVPLIVRWPGHIKPGSVRDDLVSLIDLVPTCLATAGIQAPAYLQGLDFLGKKIERRDAIFAARDRCDETVDRIRCVRTKRFKYIRNFMPERPYRQFNAYKPGRFPAVAVLQVLYKKGQLTEAQARFMAPQKPAEELYDLQEDPFEVKNLVDDPSYSDILDELRRRLQRWIEETGDLGERPEPAEEVEFWRKRMAERNAQWMKAKGLPPNPTPEQHLQYWESHL